MPQCGETDRGNYAPSFSKIAKNKKPEHFIKGSIPAILHSSMEFQPKETPPTRPAHEVLLALVRISVLILSCSKAKLAQPL
jgi:hypothetical protein